MTTKAVFRMISCDTSFLASLYLVDTHTPKARARLREIRPPEGLVLSPFHQHELPNAVRLSVFRGLRDAATGETILAAFEADLASGHFGLPTCNLASVLIEAKRLSASYTMTWGHRAFDILHVAAALHLGASEFLTFDTNQRRLAITAGLKPGPL
jgi:predicted nucleic acid-binding protein